MQRFSTWAVGLLLGAALLAPARASAQGFVVVVNEAGPAALTKDEVSRIFLQKSSKLVAVDLEKGARTRTTFSKAIIGRPVTAVVSYCQQQFFSGGDSPPSEKNSDAEVLAFVRANPKGIGYVAAGTELGSGVRAITVQ